MKKESKKLKQAQKTIENNFYRDQEGFGVGFHEYRKLNPKEVKTAESVNAAGVTDRDGKFRVDETKYNMDNYIKNTIAEINKVDVKEVQLPHHPTGYPAWAEKTLVTDRVLSKPETMRMVIGEAQYKNLLAGDVKHGLGGWATKEQIPKSHGVDKVFDHLGLIDLFKPKTRIENGKEIPNKYYVVEFEVQPGVGVREGIAGPMYDAKTNKVMPGGVKQINFIEQSPYSNPELFKINNIREIKQ